jgi:vitamin B12 transporter
MKKRSSLEAGSFNSLSLENEKCGQWKKLSYFLSTKYQTTDNDTHGDNSEAGGYDNDSVRLNTALRLDYDLRDDLALGFTYRNSDSTYETPQFGGSTTESDFDLGTLYLDYKVTDKLRSKLTLSYLMENTEFGGSSGTSKSNYDQFGISLENAYQYSRSGIISFGAEYENQDYSGFGTPNGRKDHYNAVYLNHGYDIENLTLDAGLRFEDYQSFGSKVSWKAGGKYALNEKKTYLRANVATGFNTPNFIQLFSPLAFGVAGNPNLDPETSLAWDFGIEHEITDLHTASISLFQTDLEDAILANYTSGIYENVPGESTASGIEAEIDGDITDQISYQVNYTWLDRSLSGQPEQQGDAQLVFNPSDKLQLGIGAQYLDQRSFGGNNLKDALILRAFGSYQLNDYVTLFGRIENLTDTNYSHLDFTSSFGPGDYPARRLGVHAGVTVAW